MTANNWQNLRPNPDNLLAWTLALSIILHAVILAIEFRFPGTVRTMRDKALDIILVNSKSQRAPKDAQALAQHNLDAGGESSEKIRAQSPLPPTNKQQEGVEVEQVKKQVQELEAQSQKLLAQQKKTEARLKNMQSQEDSPTIEAAPRPDGRDLADAALAMARLQAEISKNTVAYNERPQKRNIGARTTEYRFAQYSESWREKVERVGTINYPEKARGKLYGSLVLTVTIKPDGSIESIEIDRSSGHKVLDDAARRIVRLAAPFSEFPPNIRQDTDLLSITRTWYFTTNDALETR